MTDRPEGSPPLAATGIVTQEPLPTPPRLATRATRIVIPATRADANLRAARRFTVAALVVALIVLGSAASLLATFGVIRRSRFGVALVGVLTFTGLAIGAAGVLSWRWFARPDPGLLVVPQEVVRSELPDPAAGERRSPALDPLMDE